MCVTKLPPTSGCGARRAQVPSAEEKGNRGSGESCDLRAPSQHRVLRAASSRDDPRSVDRGCAGRNATSVKGLSPDNQIVSVVAEQVCRSEGNIHRKVGATGVRDHGMYRRPAVERERSVRSRVERQRPWPQGARQGLNAEWVSILRAEVRCPHSSDEAGQRPWSEGGHGE